MSNRRSTLLLMFEASHERDELAGWLHAVGYMVTCPVRGTTLEQMVQAAAFDVALLAMDHPGVRAETLADLRDRYPETLFVAVPTVDDEFSLQALESGVEYVVTRPLSAEGVVDGLRRAADHRQESEIHGSLTLTISRVGVVDRYCPACRTIVADAGSTMCFECESPRPADGWPPIEGSRFRWLGRTVKDRYTVDRYLGGGATSQVYRARDRRLHRHLALKFVGFDPKKPVTERQLLAQLIQQEVMATSRLSSPHIVKTREILPVDAMTVVLVMDYVRGSTISRWIRRRGALSVLDALSVGRQIAFALDEAHRNGMVHRDIKPANVMLERMPNKSVFARLLDFGLVHVADDPSASLPGLFFGTPGFSSPEQIKARPGIDGRADVYGLGCLLYYMLTGSFPWGEGRARDICMRQLSDPPPRLPEEVGQSALVQEDLQHLLDMSMQRRPADRFSSVRAMVREMERIARAQGLSLASVPTSRRVPSTDVNYATRTQDLDVNTDVGTRTTEVSASQMEETFD